MKKHSKFIYKLTHYEFWPWYAMFIPVLPAYLYAAISTGKLLYFTASNPSIPMGGFFGELKDDIMDMIDEQYKAKTLSIRAGQAYDYKALFELHEMEFPVIAKPNVGERGYLVHIIQNQNELEEYAKRGFDYIIQEKVNHPLELGILYSKLPNEEKGKVSSICLKEYISVRGDGRSTVQELIQNHPRHFIYLNLLQREFSDRLQLVPKANEQFVVHTIGNHSKGSRFIDITSSKKSIILDDVFTKICSNMKGFDYGRFDLKVKSWESLLQGENIKIFELNGISSEPGSIYGQKNVFQAYRILYEHWQRIYQISKYNIKKGVKTTPFKNFISQVYGHFFT